MRGEQQLARPSSSHALRISDHPWCPEAGGLAWSWAREPEGTGPAGDLLVTFSLASN